ncbi:unnamed protein product [Dovyalis caffra]|uniref:Glycosyl transferase CAP10 domain-containing protein n=1 Tax=Dovyalis caffra TaxID=77055 RepID=A0AAV1SC11_9ROSI|nr:unnamed protein product [Dovyalis caffra]
MKRSDASTISVIVAVPLNLKILFTGRPRTYTEFPLSCSNQSITASCMISSAFEANKSSAMACPDHFRWIHEDLRPWTNSGISRDTLERAKKYAHFRLVIIEGKTYVEKYSKAYQTRDLFTIWGILQLLNLYPGKIPDLELMFRCGDKTVIQKYDFQGPDAMSPPGIVKGSEEIKWQDREPYAYWRGNPYVSPNREDLLKCNVSNKYDWFARIYEQASVLLLPIRSRSLVPMQHYWPIRANNKCKDIKFAVEWGNNHNVDAQAIGKAGSKFIQENLKMEYVYDYMFHLLKEYAKLLKFKPKIPAGAVEVSSEAMASSEDGLCKIFMEASMVKSPSDALIPCTMHKPPPYDPSTLQNNFERKEKITKHVEMWKTEDWENLNKKTIESASLFKRLNRNTSQARLSHVRQDWNLSGVEVVLLLTQSNQIGSGRDAGGGTRYSGPDVGALKPKPNPTSCHP